MAANWTAFVAAQVLTAAQLNGVVDNFQDIAIFNETQATNTAGGASVATTYTKRTLNTTIVNNIGATLTASVIALVAGTYTVEAISCACRIGITPTKYNRLNNRSSRRKQLSEPNRSCRWLRTTARLFYNYWHKKL